MVKIIVYADYTRNSQINTSTMNNSKLTQVEFKRIGCEKKTFFEILHRNIQKVALFVLCVNVHVCVWLSLWFPPYTYVQEIYVRISMWNLYVKHRKLTHQLHTLHEFSAIIIFHAVRFSRRTNIAHKKEKHKLK